MTTLESTLSAAAVIESAKKIAAELGARASEIEAARQIPPDLLHELVAAGCFRILWPPSHGGAGGTLAEATELYTTLARGDASTGWTVMIGAGGWCDLASIPRATFDELFPPAAEVIVAGAFAPTGSITPIESGYELTGRWAFASGCNHATHFFANAVEGFDDGRPMMRGSVLSPDDVTIEDTWNVAGLRGTGSHHFSVNGTTVPPERTFVPLVDAPCIDEAIVRVPTPSMFAICIASVAIGAAEGALDDIQVLAKAKVPFLAAATLATDPRHHDGLARADASLRAAGALLAETTDVLWQRAEAGDEVPLDEIARARAAASWAVETALATTEFAYRAGGGTAVYDDSPLQRRLRDVYAVTQHFLVRPESFVAAGGVLSGQPLSVPVF